MFPDRDPCLVDAAGRPEQDGVTPVAYVNIMQGCDNFCAYCIVPYTRGPRKSRSTKAVLDECRAWVARGAGDITLLGQNVNVFGNDKSGDGTTFPELLRQVAAIPGLRRIRFVSAHPRDFSQETIDMFAELPQLCPRLHLPLQSGSDSMLKKMGRGYDMERYLSVVEALRKARPDVALSTDLIVGFPSETEEEFEDTLKAIDSCGFMSSFSFCYSDRPGTRASAMLFKIPHEVQLERLDRLQSLQNERAEAWLRTRVGLETDVLLEGPSHRAGGGRQRVAGPRSLGRHGEREHARRRRASRAVRGREDRQGPETFAQGLSRALRFRQKSFGLLASRALRGKTSEPLRWAAIS